MKYRLKSVPVEAIRWDGFSLSSMRKFAGKRWKIDYDFDSEILTLTSREGVVKMHVGDWLIKNETTSSLKDVCHDIEFNQKYELIS